MEDSGGNRPLYSSTGDPKEEQKAQQAAREYYNSQGKNSLNQNYSYTPKNEGYYMYTKSYIEKYPSIFNYGKEYTKTYDVKYEIKNYIISIPNQGRSTVILPDLDDFARTVLRTYERQYGYPMPDRTLSGISWEIRIHRNINIILPWQKNAQVTDMGSFSNDGNAKFFEDTAPKNSLFG